MPATRTVILIKHSAPVLERDVAPKLWRLSEEGRRRSVVLADFLRRYGPEIFVSSGEPKAVETAEIAAECLGIGHHVYPGLHEHDRTGAPFLDADEFRQKAKSFFGRPDELVWGNETAEEAEERFERALRDVLDGRDEDVVAVVAHGTVISLFVAGINGQDAHRLWERLGLPSLCVLGPDLRLREVVGRVEAPPGG